MSIEEKLKISYKGLIGLTIVSVGLFIYTGYPTYLENTKYKKQIDSLYFDSLDKNPVYMDSVIVYEKELINVNGHLRRVRK